MPHLACAAPKVPSQHRPKALTPPTSSPNTGEYLLGEDAQMNRNFEPLTARAIVAASTHRQTASARVVVGIDDTPLDAFRQTLLVAAAEAVRRH